MIGFPIFKIDDKVSFEVKPYGIVTGVVKVVDGYGTFFYEDDVCYDVYSEEHNIFFKHIPEFMVSRVKE